MYYDRKDIKQFILDKTQSNKIISAERLQGYGVAMDQYYELKLTQRTSIYCYQNSFPPRGKIIQGVNTIKSIKEKIESYKGLKGIL